VSNPQDNPRDVPQRSAVAVVLLGEVQREQAREHVVAMALHAESEVKRLEALRDSLDWTNGDGHFYGRAALEYGLRMNATEGEWANWLVNKIDQRATK
jgi:DNA-binding IclR family transcriptional regulator